MTTTPPAHPKHSWATGVPSFSFGLVAGGLLALLIKKRGFRDRTDEPDGSVRTELQAAEEEMQLIYQNILVRCLSNPDENAHQASKLSEAQKAWATFRDAHIAAIYPEEGEHGAVAELRKASIRAELTRERIRQLREWWE